MEKWTGKIISFSAGVGLALIAITAPRYQDLIAGGLNIHSFSFPTTTHETAIRKPAGVAQCLPNNYTTQIVSLDPLVIYIHDFLHEKEIEDILAAGEHLLKPSTVTRYGQTVESDYRTSWSAEIPKQNIAVQCILDRVWTFMGSMLAKGKDTVEPPQIVRYRNGQKFDMHHDWYEKPQVSRDGRRRAWNRISSFFAILQDNCTAGETYFPYIKPMTRIPLDRMHLSKSVWRMHEDGGLVFPPIRRNALFWVNLFPTGKGDPRVEHAGLPVKEGLKTAINIWPRQYVGPESWDPLEGKATSSSE
jgi:prolyl 4-hydroxylase